MFRKLVIAILVVAVTAVAAAQTQQIAPTRAPTTADAIAKGSAKAEVSQTVNLIIPQATALHLDASTLTFDITKLDGNQWAERARSGETPDGFNLACVYALGADVTSTLNPTFWGQTQTLPGGTKYDAGTYPNISVTGTPVVNYPPLRLDSNNELIPGSKNYIVCYQSFIMQLFSNFGFWDLQVSRNDTTSQGIQHLYVQGNTCSDFGDGTGLYALNDKTVVHLIPKSLNAGTTGMQAMKSGSKCDYANSSWLDVLGVLAVKVNSDFYGTSVANLTYTLLSSDTQF